MQQTSPSKTLVAYRSKYGSTKKYATWLAESLHADLKEYAEVTPNNLQEYGTILYGGWLMAGKVNGVDLLTKNWEQIKEKRVFLLAVGMSEADPETIPAVQKNNLLPSMEAVTCFYLRGAMHYQKFSLFHKLMMRAFRSMLQKKPAAERKAWENDLLEHFFEGVDFTNRENLTPLLNLLS